ncbi:hypothetical protein FO519_002054 [Halicephalobus sp. NKZ332]|nr:hypothetical protein FO519_002054 [Halicephalobus sp. NKZ332]
MRSVFGFIFLSIIFSVVHGISKPIKESINELPKANLTRRPLNLYITANGVHVKPEEKKVTVNSKESVYIYSQPPFAIKTRGLILILTSRPELYSKNRPSLLQMLAASGHRVLLIDWDSVSTKNVLEFIEKDPVTQAIVSKKWDNLEAAVFVGFDSKNLEKLSKLKIPVLILGKVGHEGFGNSQTLSIENPSGSFDKDEVMHILQNFLDLLHVR